MTDKQLYWDKKILPWENKRYAESVFFKSSIYHRLMNAQSLIESIYRPGMKVLEFGCGSGKLASLLPEDCHYQGLDFAPSAIEQARKNFSHNEKFQFEQADLTTISGPWQADIVVGLGFIDWIKPRELEKIISQCKCEYLILSFSNDTVNWMTRLYALYSGVNFPEDYRPLFYTPKKIEELLSTYGMRAQKFVFNNGMLFGGLVLAKQ